MAAALEKHAQPVSETALRLFNDIRAWIQDDSMPFAARFGYTPGVASEFVASRHIRLSDGEPGKIVLVQQFYVASDPRRHAENVACLRFNLENEALDKILLLNERVYNPDELGLDGQEIPAKIEQVVIGRRLSYWDAVVHSAQLEPSFVILANTDIFTDGSVTAVRRCALARHRRVLCQLRYEYTEGKQLGECLPFGAETGFPRQPNSQDAWIWHTGHKIPAQMREAFHLRLGTPGCDNAIAHRFGMAGFERCNCPSIVRTYHNHRSELRSYHRDPSLKSPAPYQLLLPSYCTPSSCQSQRVQSFDRLHGNRDLGRKVAAFLQKGTPFLMPRVAGIENDVAALGAELQQNGRLAPDRRSALKRGIAMMAKHAGIHLPTNEEVVLYSTAYLEALKNAQTYFTWAPWGIVARHYAMSFTFVETNFTQPSYDAGCLDVYDAIWAHPWTWGLRGKRVLIVSPFVETIKKQLAKKNVYPVDLFPECSFVFLTPPQTQAGSGGRPFSVELASLTNAVRRKANEFDVALCSCGGYGNPLCHEIYKMGKSAVYVGGVLQMYFGILGSRWERERPEVVTAYKNDAWTRPSAAERPPGYESVEGSCYW
tara:strand:+ start:242 stop:2035 length:1794 start_codon:yes stop_codon:yes gene_type:complete